MSPINRYKSTLIGQTVTWTQSHGERHIGTIVDVSTDDNGVWLHINTRFGLFFVEALTGGLAIVTS